MKKINAILSGIMLGSALTFTGCGGETNNDVWVDNDTGLTWQKKSKDADVSNFRGIIPIEGYEYCRDLELGGYNDWRLPTYAELQSIVAGSPNIQEGGSCKVGEPGAGTAQGKTSACAGAPASGEYGGPGQGGCYWKDGLEGDCDRIDPYGTHPYETIAADVSNDKPEDWISYITFANGTAGYNHACSLAEVRCVRSDTPAPECIIDGKPCVEHYRAKSYCDQDMTPLADVLRVTVSVPEDPKVDPPYQIVGFLYEADRNWFPPLGPPDGGTDYNQIFLGEPGAPTINANTPLVMDIPAVTYYREALLEGDFQLFFELQMVSAFPPIPVQGDFVYGEGQAPISLPLNGSSHTGEVMEMDIELELVGCPADTPFACPDGSCAVDSDACPIAAPCPEDSSCYPNCPSDAEILTCIYANQFDGGAAAKVDYPLSEGWTEASALANCQAIQGSENEQLVQGGGQSALVSIGGNSSGKCVFTENGMDSYAQDIGSTFCGLGGGTWEETGPYCTTY